MDVTTSLDTENDVICGTTTSLSPFLVAQKHFAFTGFFRPLANLPTLNLTKAGSAIPLKFSLGGDKGLGILASGFPTSQQVACDTSTPQGTVDEIATAGSSSLSYDSSTGQYTYIWKTDKAWARTCRQLIVKLIDGKAYRANFSLTR